MIDQITNILQTIITIGGGAWIVSWLKDVIKETFKKIEDLEKKVTKMEHEAEFREKYNIKNGDS